MATPFPNVYTHRRVAETDAKPCAICQPTYRPSTSVLITPDKTDWFYVCASHLTDRAFATPVVDEAAERERRLQEEVERVKREWAEREKRRKEREKEKKEEEKEGEKTKDGEKEKEKKEKEKEEKEGETLPGPEKKEGPKQYKLHVNFFNMRLRRAKELAQAKRNMELLRNPSAFPSVPKGGPV